VSRCGFWIGFAILALFICLPSLAADEKVAQLEAPALITVVEIPEDTFTRGNWQGAYGRRAYVLCGMRSPKSLYGGPDWPVNFFLRTGDPKEGGRAWRSTMAAEGDRGILLEPNGLTRTPAVFDDYGETYPLGKGPDLHLELDVPEGPHLLSLYFFECDWIQYRSYTISLYEAGENAGPPLLTSRVGDFLKGKYKRFAVTGPARLRVVIAKGNSPNAVVSGLFLDGIARPETALLDVLEEFRPDGTREGRALAEDAGLDAAQLNAAEVLAQALAGNAPPARYFEAELQLYRQLQRLYDADVAEYLKTSNPIWREALARLETSLESPLDADLSAKLGFLAYHVSRSAFDNESAVAALSGPADYVAYDETLGAAARRADLLDDLSGALLAEGRRLEAKVLLQAYCRLCLNELSADEARDRLISMGNRAIPVRVTAPCAEALLEWERRHGEALAGDDEALLANLLYLAGMSAEAAGRYRNVAQGVIEPERHKWFLVAKMSAELRAGQREEALSTLRSIESAYPDDPAYHDAMFRLALHYFEKRDYVKAREWIQSLLKQTVSEHYKGMCDEVLSRIEYREAAGAAQ
jgi:tetratricopeptide (TPR) repeat protein